MAKGKYQEWLTNEGLTLIEGWARDGLTDEQISNNIGIRAGTLYDWKKKYPEISESLKKGKEVIDKEVENALIKSALGYSYVETTKERLEDSDSQRERHSDEGNAYIELTTSEWETAKQAFEFSCAFCGHSDDVELTKDHLVPLSKGGHMSKANVVPACRQCNSSKNDRDWKTWYPKQKFYSKERYNKIVSYIDIMSAVSDKEMDKTDNSLVVTKEVTKHVQPNTTAQIFWLKNRRPDAWRDKQDVEHSGGMNNNVDLSGLSLKELRNIAEQDPDE